MSDLILRARVFATAAHAAVGQKRKYTGEDYIVHPKAVADIVLSTMAEYGDPFDEAMIAAAWLHDTVEDTEITYEHILAEFGSDVAGLVWDLTDTSMPTDGNREIRKRIDREHTQRASARAKTIKLADLIDNTASTTVHDKGFATVFYMAEKKLLLPSLKDGDAVLWARANKLVEDWDNHAG